MSMLKSVAAFEIEYQVRSPMFWASAIGLLVLSILSVVAAQLSVASAENIFVNSPFSIVQTYIVIGLISLFVIVTFVANSIIRDDETRFAPLLRATQLGRSSYFWGRFLGSTGVALLILLTAPLGMMIGALLPGIKASTIGPFDLWNYAYPFLTFLAPMILIFAAILFSVATVARSMMAAYLALIAIFVSWTVGDSFNVDPGAFDISALVDPTGVTSLFLQTRYWLPFERNTLMPALTQPYLINRFVWALIAVVSLFWAWRSFLADKAPKASSKPAPKTPELTADSIKELPDARTRKPTSGWVQFWYGVQLDVLSVLRSPAFLILLLIGLLAATLSLLDADKFNNVPMFAVTRTMVDQLQSVFAMVPIIIAAYYAGELVWRDRENRIAHIIDATPVSNWVLLLPKVLAIFIVLALTALAAALAAMVVQMSKGYFDFSFGEYLRWWIWPTTVGALHFAVFAVFLQIISPSKYVGFGLTTLFLIVRFMLPRMGLENFLYRFGEGPDIPISDFNGMAHFWVARGWFDLYWAAAGLILLILGYLLLNRGESSSIATRLAAAKPRFTTGSKLALAGSVAAFSTLGGFIYYNTHILNAYTTQSDDNRAAAEAEKALSPFLNKPTPQIVRVEMDVDLRPKLRKASLSGSYVIENKTAQPLTHMLLIWPKSLTHAEASVPNAQIEKQWAQVPATYYRFDSPMKPGEQRRISFETAVGRPGFPNNIGALSFTTIGSASLVNNGTFIFADMMLPALAPNRLSWLDDPTARKEQGLPDIPGTPKLEDNAANLRTATRSDLDSGSSRINVTTDDDQLPIAPGLMVAETRKDGRITRRFELEKAILSFSIQSARYKVHTASVSVPSGPVKLEIFYHPEHGANVARMEKAMRTSLEIFSNEFGAYPHSFLRIVEFPAYGTFAFAFPGTVPFSEDIGWLQTNSNPGDIDIVSYVTAHEVGHQWWGQLLQGADKQGGGFLYETLAQYSGMLTMERLHSAEMLMRVRRYELGTYLSQRVDERREEQPISRSEGQGYLTYNKGSMVMYHLKSVIGEAPINRALKRLVAQFANKGAPYPDMRDFMRLLREEAGPAHQQLITDLFERILLHDLRASNAARVKLPDGRWALTVTVDARRIEADGKGREKTIGLDEDIEIGVFNNDPRLRDFTKANVLLLKKVRLKTGQSKLKLILPAGVEPTYVAVDPYVRRIDRDTNDNIAEIQDAK
jgi:ABC-2 type transport system permease protein